MSDADALERRLLPPKAKGTPDEFWLLVTRRASLAKECGDAKQAKQHLAIASLFAGRGFRSGERDCTRLTAYLGLFREAQAKQCFPLQLQATQARMMNELRSAGGIVEPEILAKKSKNVLTHVAMFLIADETHFDAISNDHTRWSDDRGMRATVQAGLGLFICTGADGAARHEVRIVDRDDLALGSQEYKQLTSSAEPVSLALPSGRLRLGPPVATSAECLEVDVAPGVYRVALYSLRHGEKFVVVAARTDLPSATNAMPEVEPRYGQSMGGILNA